jgi:hypothetical protein
MNPRRPTLMMGRQETEEVQLRTQEENQTACCGRGDLKGSNDYFNFKLSKN